MNSVRNGTRSPEVKLLQRLLNLRLRSTPRLAEDSRFGSKTEAAVKQFQGSKRLPQNGVADLATWRALGVTIDVSHRVRLYLSLIHI